MRRLEEAGGAAKSCAAGILYFAVLYFLRGGRIVLAVQCNSV